MFTHKLKPFKVTSSHVSHIAAQLRIADYIRECKLVRNSDCIVKYF